MKFTMKRFLLVPILASALAGCGQPDSPPEQPSQAASEAKPEENLVTLTKENLQYVRIQTETARLDNLGMALKTPGRISANWNKTARITSTLEGRVTRLNFDLTDRVKAGEVMALAESPELLGKPLELKAPMDGVVIERLATMGDLVDRAKPVYTISDLAQLWAIAEVKERDIAAVKLAQDATFTTLAYPEEKFHGKVVRISDEVEPGPRTLEVRIAVDNADGRLDPGLMEYFTVYSREPNKQSDGVTNQVSLTQPPAVRALLSSVLGATVAAQIRVTNTTGRPFGSPLEF